jgi:hypothetical protein
MASGGQVLEAQPQRGDAKPGGAQGILRVGGDKQHFFRLHRKRFQHPAIALRRGFDLANASDG